MSKGLDWTVRKTERLTPCEVDPVAKTELLELASSWRQVAVNYEYIQSSKIS